MFSITKRLDIDAGHRLLGHEGKCRHVHGHRYSFIIQARADGLDSVGRVVDFSVIKSCVGGWLDENWDHGFIAQNGDPIIAFLREQGSKVFVLAVSPTAENLAAHLFEVAEKLLYHHGVSVEGVTCVETPTSSAEYNP